MCRQMSKDTSGQQFPVRGKQGWQSFQKSVDGLFKELGEQLENAEKRNEECDAHMVSYQRQPRNG